MKKLSLGGRSLLGLMAQPAFAENSVIRGVEVSGVCASDVVRLCMSVLPGKRPAYGANGVYYQPVPGP